MACRICLEIEPENDLISPCNWIIYFIMGYKEFFTGILGLGLLSHIFYNASISGLLYLLFTRYSINRERYLLEYDQ